MFDNLKKLADKLEGEAKSEFLVEIEGLENKGLRPMPKSLDEIHSSEEYADLKRLLNAREGQLRTKWEAEIKKEPEIKEPETNGNDDLKKFFEEKFGGLQNELLTLKGEKNKDTLRSHAKEQLKDLPEKTLSLISVTDNSTQDEIDTQIATAKEVYAEARKSIDQTPRVGQGIEVTDSEFDEVLNQIKESNVSPKVKEK